MADLVAADVTVTSMPKDRARIADKWRFNIVSIAFGNGALTIPAGGGVPLPALGHFGMNKFLVGLIVISGNGAYEYSYDKVNHVLKAYHGDYSASSDGPHVNAGTAAPAAQALEAIAIGE